MKIRNGFISNSSSSSFIIAWKGDIEKELKEAFTFKGEYPIVGHHDGIVGTFIDSMEKGKKGCTIKDIKDNFDFEEGDDEEYNDEAVQLLNWLKQDYKVSFGSFGDQEGPTEELLCNSEIKWDKENLKIISEGGY